MIQAWFVGSHGDIGGGNEKDGLSLYPLQWMLLESRNKGLVIEYERPQEPMSWIVNPLNVVFPTSEDAGSGSWTCHTANGIKVEMHDLCNLHRSSKYGSRFAVKLNQRSAAWMGIKFRRPFCSQDLLTGYNENCTLTVTLFGR